MGEALEPTHASTTTPTRLFKKAKQRPSSASWACADGEPPRLVISPRLTVHRTAERSADHGGSVPAAPHYRGGTSL